MIKVNNVIKKYSQFVSKYPITIILIVVLITGFTAYYAKNVAIETTSEKDNLPDNYPVIESLNYVEDNFGGYDSVMIAIQLNKELYSVNDITDLRDPSIITYIDKLTKLCNTVENVSEVNSISTLLKSENNDLLPKDKTKINKILSSIVNNNYISEDYTLAIINIKLTDDYKDRELANDLEQIIDEVPKPNGVTTTIAGKIFEDPIILDAVEPDMSKTSYMSLLGIIIILLFLFRSLIYGMIPLSTIGLGVIWTFGFIGLIGLNLTTMTSGVISMIMGIGIDFGIQMVIRFRSELKNYNPEIAIQNTLNNVMIPMATTTIAALIGFKAMSMGELTFLGEMGKIMSYGVTACFLVAITLIPAILVSYENFKIYLMKKWRN